MCIAMGRLNPAGETPLVVAANRDEFYERQGEPPRLHRGDPHDYLAPLDPRAGGTWIGINRAGLLVLITNRLSRADRDSDAPSRGRLVGTVLEQSDTITRAREVIGELDPTRFNPFSLLIVGPQGMVSVSHRPEDGDRWESHGSGQFLVSTEEGFEYRRRPPFWDDIPDWSESIPLPDRLQRLLGRHDSFRHRPALCRHQPEFGTLSSTLIIVDRESGPWMSFAQGPACMARFRDVAIPESFQERVRDAWRQSAAV